MGVHGYQRGQGARGSICRQSYRPSLLLINIHSRDSDGHRRKGTWSFRLLQCFFSQFKVNDHHGEYAIPIAKPPR